MPKRPTPPPRISLPDALDALEARYGRPAPPPVRDPFEQILQENASYLVDDARRAAVFASLEAKVGVTPERILSADRGAIEAAIAGGGMLPAKRAAKLVAAAEIAAELEAPLASIVRGPFERARKVLKRFPGVADAGAERIALFAGAHARLGLESNGVRVLVRLGFATERRSWAETWKEATAAARAELPEDLRASSRAHLLLRTHGQATCKAARPRCVECPLAEGCPAGRASVGGPHRAGGGT